MRRLLVMTGAICAAIVLSTIAYAEEPDASPCQPTTAKQTACPPSTPERASSPIPWTLFLVTVNVYGSGFTITPVASYQADTAQAEHACEVARRRFYYILGVHEANSEAAKVAGNSQHLICQPGAAPSGRPGG